MMSEEREERKSRLSIIVAMARNRVIGLNNALPWRIPADLKRFKSLTMGHHMIMGRKTHDSIGKPLPGRTTVVLSRNHALKMDGCVVVHSLEEAFKACVGDDEIFLVGGAELYALAMPLVDIIYLTEIQQDMTGDAYFPELDKNLWLESVREPCIQETPQKLEFHFVTYRRK